MKLFRAVHKLGKPLVVFVMNAGPLDLAEIKASGVPIVAGGYGGENMHGVSGRRRMRCQLDPPGLQVINL